ncbi:MAG: amidohydrolase family protein, partial [Anaerolineae bacterium]|nr:amidohydrolase family protein [Anaerolineae bacterium]
MDLLASLEFGHFRRDVPILDGHVHVWPGMEPADLWGLLRDAGAVGCNAVGITTPHGTLNEQVLAFKVASAGRAYGFGVLDYTAHYRGEPLHPDDLVGQAQALRARGLDGIKMVEGKTAYYVGLPDRFDGSFFAPFFARMEEEGFPLLMHVADPPRMWDPARVGRDAWSYAGPGYPSREEQYAEVERVLARHPRLRLILAHFLFLWDDLPKAARFLEAHPSVAFDITPGVEGYFLLGEDPAAAREFFVAYQDRLIYGTDMGAGPLLDRAHALDPARERALAWLVRATLETDWEVPVPDGAGSLLEFVA